MLKKILIITGITAIILLSILGYYYFTANKEEGNLQYVEVNSGEQILVPKTWRFTTGKEVESVLNIKANPNVKPIFFATEQKNNSKIFYYVIKEKLNGKINKEMIKTILKSTVDSERKNGNKVDIIDTGVINEDSNSINKGQFVIYKTNNLYKFIAYFYHNQNELTTFTSYLNQEVYEKNISLIKYIALKNKY